MAAEERGVRVAGERFQGSRAGQPVDERTVALYTAARAFLMAEWAGALLTVVSFAQLYLVVGARLGSGAVAVAVGLLLLAIGGFVFLRSRTYYRRLEFPWASRWERVATVVAGAGALFWLLFAFLAALTWAGYPVLPD